jgi:hypothetical protein
LFTLTLLTCLNLSSVLGISQNESINLNNIALNSLQQDQNNLATKSTYHESRTAKSIIYEAEEEDSKEKSFDDGFLSFHPDAIIFSGRESRIYGQSAILPQSLNILYCVFRI